MERKIPAVMATQHPDNAHDVAWLAKPFVTTQDEIEECYRTFFELGCDEYMWDWEGKFADEALIEKLAQKYLKKFQKRQIGRDLFVTLRIPNIWEEKSFKLGRAFMSMLTADDFAESLGLHTPPFFETILPLTTRADQMLYVQTLFEKFASLKCKLFLGCRRSQRINVIPLFESVDCLMHCDKILHRYFALYRRKFRSLPPYLRVFIARSDPALNAGFIPAVIGCKIALHRIEQVSVQTKIPLYPIVGTGGLPFRGGANPEHIECAVQTYAGVRTMTIQSAFRYDYPPDQVKRAVRYIQKHLAQLAPVAIPEKDAKSLERVIREHFIPLYRSTIEECESLINEVAKFIPSRRERMLHIGLFGYSRGIGKTTLPRAISFTGVWYSLGIPPEIIATGRGLAACGNKRDLVLKYFPTLEHEVIHACKYLNLENLDILAREYPILDGVKKDLKILEDILSVRLGPQKPNHMIHRNLTSTIINKRYLGHDYSSEIVEAGKMRRSLG